MMMCDNLQNSAATKIKTIYQTHINKMWDLIMELYEYFFLSEIYIQRGHPYLSVFLLSSRRPKERGDIVKKEDNASGGIKDKVFYEN